jgi:hypothetical protein
MRILNRPMFRYGGPIKEGIMHGMRNGGRIGFQDGTKKKKYDWFETPIGKIVDPREVPGQALLEGKKMIAGTYDLAGVPINKLTQWFSGYNPGFSGAKFMRIKPDKKDTAYWMGIPTSTKEGWTIPSMKEGPTAAEIELAKLKKKIADQKKGTMPENLGLGSYTDPNKAEKLAKEQQGERVQKYLKMMGYDSAKKGALSDALIDASALVQDASTEAGALKHADWGKLINKMIQTTSKRLDKPAQIREAVGLMSVKAAIEKDLEDPQVQKLRALKILESQEALKGSKASSIGDLVLLSKKASGKKRADAEVMKDVMAVKEPDIIAQIVGKKDDLSDIKDSLDEGVTVKDYIVEKYKGEEGIYIIDNVVVQIYPDGTSKQLY